MGGAPLTSAAEDFVIRARAALPAKAMQRGHREARRRQMPHSPPLCIAVLTRVNGTPSASAPSLRKPAFPHADSFKTSTSTAYGIARLVAKQCR